MGLSLPHILILAVVAVLLLGGGRFSALMGDVAKGVKNFKKGMADEENAVASPPTLTPPAPLIEGRTAADIIAEHERAKAAVPVPPVNSGDPAA
jgi:sec-independent protein translocase protein TatA